MTHQKKKHFGQHFLHDKSVINRIVDSVEIPEGGVAIEIGPGEGALTSELINRFGVDRVIAIEADRDLPPILREKFEGLEIVEGDASKVSFKEILKGRPWVLVGNLPYNAAASIIRHVFTCGAPPKALTIMVQKEQGERMRAKAGDMSMLSLAVQLYTSPKLLFHVGSGAFQPPPNVDSSVLFLKMNDIDGNEENVLDLARGAFLSRRKQMKSTLSKTLKLSPEHIIKALVEMGKKESARPQEFSISDWKKFEEKIRRNS